MTSWMRALAQACMLASIVLVLTTSRARAQADCERNSCAPPPPTKLTAHVLTAARGNVAESAWARVALLVRRAMLSTTEVDTAAADLRLYGDSREQIASLGTARERIALARRAYDEVDFESAARYCLEAIRWLEAAMPLLRDGNELPDVMMLLGASQQLARADADAVATYRRMHSQYTDYLPDALAYNPDIVARFQSARVRERRPVAPGQIKIRADYALGIAFLDGRPAGIAPTTFEDVAPGTHSVGVLFFTGGFQAQTVRVESASEAQARFEFSPSDLSRSLRSLVEELASSTSLETDAPQRLGRALGTDLSAIAYITPAPTPGRLRVELVIVEMRGGREALRSSIIVDAQGDSLERDLRTFVRDAFRAALRTHVVGSTTAIHS